MADTDSGTSQGRRYKVVFKNRDDFQAARALEIGPIALPVENERRLFFSVASSPESVRAADRGRTPDLVLDEYLESFVKHYDANVVEDYQFELEAASTIFCLDAISSPDEKEPSLWNVLDVIEASAAWEQSRGDDVVIAIVDTGIDGRRPEFPESKRAGSWQPLDEQPWTDWNGHGTMCACIAAASDAEEGEFSGVAPGARLMACKTWFYDTELTTIYDTLADRALEGETIVASNSFGLRTGTPPPPPEESDFPDALAGALEAGVHVVFSAGNNHDLTGGEPEDCAPNSIWLHKCRADVLTVATCDLEGSMWYYSSRGPGQFVGEPGMREKPDVTAPTPRNGRVLYGDQVRALAEGWGTSGACPQVAGLAALLLSRQPALPRETLIRLIHESATTLGFDPHCEGRGMINCRAAMDGLLVAS
jgi:serine protease AprX